MWQNLGIQIKMDIDFLTILGYNKNVQSLKVFLIVEDQKLQDFITLSLIEEGHNVKTYISSDEALKELGEKNPDIVIVDFSSPHIDGIKLSQRIRENFLFRYLPLILLIPKEEPPSSRIKAIEAGVDDFIDKPFTPIELLIRLKVTIGRISHYQDIHPLTKLPGFSALIRDINYRIEKKEIFGAAYVDLYKFQKFNEHYGFKRGDRVLLFTATVIKKVLDELGRPQDFLSHFGGDDFFFVSSAEGMEDICKIIIETFSRNIPSFYNEEDRKQGFITLKDRGGRLKEFPLLRIHIGIVTNEYYSFNSCAQVLQIATELKNYAKKFEKSMYVKERRKNYPFY